MTHHVLKKRKQAIFLMYQHYVLNLSLNQTEQRFLDSINNGWQEDEWSYYHPLISKIEEIEVIIKQNLDVKWEWNRINNIYKSILTVAIYEILFCELDKKIIIDQAVNFVHQFDPEDNFQFINKILDKIKE